MKEFNEPVLEVVQIETNDIITTSTCPGHCPDCPWCNGTGECQVY